jgi:SAM-dependent methyltransferase
VDLIISNLGINNFDNPGKVFNECHRVLKPGGKLALTTNLYGHWREFYAVFKETLSQLKKPALLEKLEAEENHRGTIESISNLYTDSGFSVRRHFTEDFEMKFVDGSAFLNHSFIKLGWLTMWMGFIPEEEQEIVFGQLERNLNATAEKAGGLVFTVPMAYVEGQK